MNPLDWALAQRWEDAGIPLNIVLRAMSDVQKNFTAQNRPDKINSLSYFTQSVEKTFAEWQTSQVGKSNSEETMPNYTMAETISQIDENVTILEKLATLLSKEYLQRVEVTLPEPLDSTVAKTRGEIFAFIDDVKKLRLSSDDIESHLQTLARELEISLVLSVSEDERAALVNSVRAERSNRLSNDEIIQKILIKKLYQKFNLPELTLFEI